MSSPPKIVVIGPLPPYQGGIPDYNALLVRELEKKYSVLTLSFSRLYPRWIYPGDLPPQVSEEKLDALAPSTWRHTLQTILQTSPQLVILHWWTGLLAPMTKNLLSKLKHAGIPVTVIIHNARPRDIPLSTQWSLKEASRFLVHNETEARRMQKLFPLIPTDIEEMPPFHHFPRTETVSADKVRLLCFGVMRKYKGIALLPKIMESLSPEQYSLECAGKWWGSRSTKLSLQRLPHVRIIDRYLSPSEVSEHFARADLMLLPYLNASASAALTVAQHFGVPILSSDLAQFKEEMVWKKVPARAQNMVQAIQSFKKHRTALPLQRNWSRLVQTLCANSADSGTGFSIRHKFSNGLSLSHS